MFGISELANTDALFHRARELEPASRIQLDANYTARNLLNLLRARTFATTSRYEMARRRIGAGLVGTVIPLVCGHI